MTARSHSRHRRRDKRRRAASEFRYRQDDPGQPTLDQLAAALVARGLAPISVLGPIPYQHTTDTDN